MGLLCDTELDYTSNGGTMMKSLKTVIFGLLISFLIVGATNGQASASGGLPAVTNLQAVVTDDKKIMVTWDLPFMVSNVTEYSISVTRAYNQVEPDATFRGPKNNTTTYYTPSYGENRYYFFVSYHLGDDVAGWSEVAYTWVDFKIPEAPGNLKLSNIQWFGMARLSWQDVNQSETAWIIDINGVDKEGTPAHKRIELTPNNDSDVSRVITSPLSSEGYYTLKVWAKAGGLIGPAREVSTYIPMCAPSQLTTETRLWDSGAGVELAWQDNSHKEDGFQIERTNPDGSKNSIEVTSDTEWYPDQRLEYASEYSYRIRAISNRPSLNSSWSDPVSVTTPRFSKLTSLARMKKPSQSINIQWMPVATPDLSSDSDEENNEDISSTEDESTQSPDSAVENTEDASTSDEATVLIEVENQNPSQSSAPAGEGMIIRLYIGKTDYYVGSSLKSMDTAPLIMQERTMLPIRYVAEPLGAVINWDDVEKKVTISLEDNNIELWINQNRARVNGQYKMLDETNSSVVPVIVPSGRTVLPLRFIAENLGCQVNWNPATQEVTITP